jgi:hypothetical protein
VVRTLSPPRTIAEGTTAARVCTQPAQVQERRCHTAALSMATKPYGRAASAPARVGRWRVTIAPAAHGGEGRGPPAVHAATQGAVTKGIAPLRLGRVAATRKIRKGTTTSRGEARRRSSGGANSAAKSELTRSSDGADTNSRCVDSVAESELKPCDNATLTTNVDDEWLHGWLLMKKAWLGSRARREHAHQAPPTTRKP